MSKKMDESEWRREVSQLLLELLRESSMRSTRADLRVIEEALRRDTLNEND